MLDYVDRAATGNGPLDGVSVAVKELIAIGGHTLSANSDVPLPETWRHPVDDAPIVAALRANGAHVVGTTTTHEFAWGITTYDRGRRVDNPVMPGRIAGGSSGGSAESVALGEADLGIGTDTGGSVRIPAAWCHLVGWKFGEGLISMDGVLPLALGLDHVGLLARSPELLLRAADALGVESVDYVPAIVVPPAEFLARSDPAAVAIVFDTVRLLTGALNVEESTASDMPPPEQMLACFSLLQGPAVVRAHRDVIGTWPSQRRHYPDYIVDRLNGAEARDDQELALGRHLQADIRARLNTILERSIMVLPATGCAPPSIDSPNEAVIGDQRHDLRDVVMTNTVPANVSGLPAVTVPFRSGGEEFGVQLLGPAGSDRLLLELAASVMSAHAS